MNTFTLALTVHLIGAIASFTVAYNVIRYTLRSSQDLTRKNLFTLAGLMAFDGLTGTILAIASHTKAISVCDNIAYYVAMFVGVALFSIWFPSRTKILVPSIAQPMMLGVIIPFVPVLIASIFGL